MNRKEILKKYRQTDKGKMNNKISTWKNNATKINPNHKGLICDTRDDYELVYFTWLNSSRCENCNKEYSKGNYKSMDHCHNTGIFRNILCHSCNSNLNSSNTSGTPNISWRNDRNCWRYIRTIKGKKYVKCSKDLEWLKNYKKELELKHIYNN